MRYRFLLILPVIFSSWIIFLSYKGFLSRRHLKKSIFYVENHLRILNLHEDMNVERTLAQNAKKALSKSDVEETYVTFPTTRTSSKVATRSVIKESKKESENVTFIKGSESNNKVNCSKDGQNLFGPLMVDQSLVKNMKKIERLLSVQYGGWVEKGGAWKPQHCRADRKVAIILPYRNRYEQLKIFLRHLHPILKRQSLHYRIFIVEQEGNVTVFNRGILFNIGFKEVQKLDNYRCFIFHDVDLLPEDDKNMYNCPTSPRHMCPAVDKFLYQLPYQELFGGVEAFWKEHFEKVNGFSNKYWGWGGEDDDLHRRCVAQGLKPTRSSMKTGRFKMLQEHHHVDGRKDRKRTRKLLNRAVPRMMKDGLNTLKYTLRATLSYPLYTGIKVEVDPSAV